MSEINTTLMTVYVGAEVEGINIQFEVTGRMVDDSLVDRSIQAYEGLDSRYKAEVEEIKFDRGIYSKSDLKEIDEWLSYNEYKIEEDAMRQITDKAY